MNPKFKTILTDLKENRYKEDWEYAKASISSSTPGESVDFFDLADRDEFDKEYLKLAAKYNNIFKKKVAEARTKKGKKK